MATGGAVTTSGAACTRPSPSSSAPGTTAFQACKEASWGRPIALIPSTRFSKRGPGASMYRGPVCGFYAERASSRPVCGVQGAARIRGPCFITRTR